MKRLETERLILRKITRDDTRTIFESWASDPDVARYVTWKAHKSIEDTMAIMDFWLSEYEKPDCYRWGMELKSTHALIGMIDVVGKEADGTPYLGYVSAKKYWNHGYMTEALHAVVEELFANGCDELSISAVEDNKASNRVIEKNVFVLKESRVAPISPFKTDVYAINTYRLKKPE
jgi:ribosomal-protein-alanine N-acetyltransferase